MSARPPRVQWPPFRRVHRTFHELWTQAAGQAGYDKRRWKRLELLIDDLALLARGELTEEAIERFRAQDGEET